MTITYTDPLCENTASGTIKAVMTDGGSGFGIRLVDKQTGHIVFYSRTEAGISNATYDMENIPAGTYTVLLDVLGETIDAQTEDVTRLTLPP